LAHPLAAESDEYEQQPPRDVGETPAAPLVSRRIHRPGALARSGRAASVIDGRPLTIALRE
jgi:hypothetical protein